MEKLKKYLIYSDAQIKEAYEKLESVNFKTLIVVNKKNKFLGTLTDGDIRRGVLNGSNFQDKISNFYNKKALVTSFKKKSLNLFKKKLDVNMVPVLNKKSKIVDILFNKKNNEFQKLKKKFKTKVVIMAGGIGSRLRPYTYTIPKPLMPLGEKSILERIIQKFEESGFNNFYLTVGYKKELINAYFTGSKFKNKIKIIPETKPLGTAGGISFLKGKIKEDFFVCNCDSIYNLDFNFLLDFHKNRKNELTIVAAHKKIEIPYGVCEIKKNNFLKNIKEKPHFKYFANTGLYVFSKRVLDMIKKNTASDMDVLIQKCLKKKIKVGVFPIDQKDWHDFGEWDKFKVSSENLKMSNFVKK